LIEAHVLSFGRQFAGEYRAVMTPHKNAGWQSFVSQDEPALRITIAAWVLVSELAWRLELCELAPRLARR